MSDQDRLPYVFMRGGTSRGPYFRRDDLPQDSAGLRETLLAVIGSGHPLNIDGIGGGSAVTTKVAMLSRSSGGWADIDYYFAQVGVEKRLIDFKPTCGNILTGVAPAAIELGLLKPKNDKTEVKILAVNTGARVIADIHTPGGRPYYRGDTRIDGVPGRSAAIRLKFLDVSGSLTGAILPTGSVRDTFDGIETTCMDVAMPMVIAKAEDFDLSGYECAANLDANRTLLSRIESIRRQAGLRMGLGDVSDSVVPKFGLLAPACEGGTFAARYFMPWKTHPSMAVTGSQCLAVCVLFPGSVGDHLSAPHLASPANVVIEHASGKIEVQVEFSRTDDSFELISSGLVRTARKLADGNVYFSAGFCGKT